MKFALQISKKGFNSNDRCSTTVVFNAAEGPCIVGSNASDITLTDSALAEKHFLICGRKDGTLQVIDLIGDGKITIDGKPAHRCIIRGGDAIHVGNLTLVVQ